METILAVKDLSKRFKQKTVLKNVSFTVNQGEILCLLGPNGAGKSTTINILTGMLGHDGGEVLYHGQNIRGQLKAYKQHLGVVPQDIALYEELSAERNLHFFAALYGLRGQALDHAVDEALALAGLEDRRHDAVKTFSGGMKRRLNIACAIAHHPELVIMDEPTVGIDPQSRNHILDSIRTLREGGMTVLYTTHYMEEVEAISTRIIIMDHGEIIAEGTKESLKQAYQDETHYTLTVARAEALQVEDLYRIEGVKTAQVGEDTVEIASLRGMANLDRIIAALYQKNVEIKNITSEEASLETVFLKLTGRTLRD
ncbi:MAG: ABC transporter ATP-binding protein [Ethanoligenens sp.]